jgi:hypothetical protein
VILLDRQSAKLTARAEFTGAKPKAAPSAGKPATGPKPLAAVRDWLIQAEIGKPATDRYAPPLTCRLRALKVTGDRALSSAG